MERQEKAGMDRRKFLSAAALTSAWLLTRRRAAAAMPRAAGGSAVVIGAGIAGLAAADALKTGGRSVVVLEGRDRVGGRIWTDRSLGSPVDMGAAWIEGARGNPIAKLARRFKVKRKRTNYNSEALYDFDGGEVDESVEDRFADLEDAMDELEGNPLADHPIEQALPQLLGGQPLSEQEARYLNWVYAGIEVETGANVREVSLNNAEGDEAFPGPDVLMHGGYDGLALGLAQGQDIRLNQRVTRISHSAAGVEITTDQGPFHADVAVVTLPLGVLKSESVEFAPALPAAKTAAIQRLGMGCITKVVLSFPRVFWPKRKHFLSYVSRTRGEFPEFLNLYPYSRQPILVAAVAGDYEEDLEQLPDAEIQARVMDVLRRLFGPEIPQPLGIRVTRWDDDPFARGVYSHVPIGASFDDYNTLAEPVDGRLFFAGEATNAEYPATVHGAFLSGLREAERILGTEP